MDQEKAILTLAALAQPTRLQAFNLIVRHEPEGVPAGDVAKMLAVPQNTMSSHLSVLARAGLIRAERRSRLMIYRAELAVLRDLTLYLLNDCCGGKAELCEPLIAQLTPCCPPQKVSS
ncbi:MAG: metalloregulator ArsR/SmtB family transcription factor [Pseudorhizobium pelagicum]|uniref:ArsR/SmtB family transcription factor n=1 Tax=Pseudorhizobium pelagicum TaxID=1509405 RepID=UPI00345F4BCE